MAYEGFRHAVHVTVRWADLDALGHVNNAIYLTYLEQARIHFIRSLGLWDGKPDKLGLIMAKVVLDYKLPLTDIDQVTVYTRVARLGSKSFETEQHIVRGQGAHLALAATGLITAVVYDYPAQQTAPIPADWRAKLAAYST
jgi:acyl-CoA thioester hydrolase